MYRAYQRRPIPQRAQNSGFGTLQRFGANVHDCPIKQAAILFRRERDNLHPRIPAEQKATLGDAFVGVLERENQDVGLGLFDRLRQFALIMYFANHFDIGLVRDYGEDKLSHQSGTVCNQNSHSFHRRSPRQTVLYSVAISNKNQLHTNLAVPKQCTTNRNPSTNLGLIEVLIDALEDLGDGGAIQPCQTERAIAIAGKHNGLGIQCPRRR